MAGEVDGTGAEDAIADPEVVTEGSDEEHPAVARTAANTVNASARSNHSLLEKQPGSIPPPPGETSLTARTPRLRSSVPFSSYPLLLENAWRGAIVNLRSLSQNCEVRLVAYFSTEKAECAVNAPSFSTS